MLAALSLSNIFDIAVRGKRRPSPPPPFPRFSIESRQSLSPSLSLLLKIFGNKGLEFEQDYIHIDIWCQFQVQCILESD